MSGISVAFHSPVFRMRPWRFTPWKSSAERASAIISNAIPGDIQRGMEADFLAYMTKHLDLNPTHRENDRVPGDSPPAVAHEDKGHV